MKLDKRYIVIVIAFIMHGYASAQLPRLIDAFQRENYDVNPILNNKETPAEQIQKNIFIKVSANKTSCFVGEPILVSYELFSGLRSQSKVSKQPSFSGCSVIEMTTDEPPTVKRLGDKLYKVFLIRRVQLVPLQEGKLKMDIAAVDNDVSFSLAANPYETQSFTGTVKSTPLVIDVKALPDKNKPANFSGIVGSFKIHSKVDSASIAKGENNILQVSIKGEGNFGGIDVPNIEWPKGTEHFDGSDSQHIDKMQFPAHGDVTFNIPFIGTKEGAVTIPVISFTYFDAATAHYATIKTKDIHVLITHALAKNIITRDIVTEDITTRKYLWIVPAIALSVCFVWIVSSKKGRKQDLKKQAKAEEVKRLQAKAEESIEPVVIIRQTDFGNELRLLENITDQQEFFTQAKAILTLALQEKLKTDIESEHLLITAVQEQTKDVALAQTIETLYKVCNRSLYSPVADEDVKALTFRQLNNVIERLLSVNVYN